MAVYFFDTSAIVKRYVIETGTPWVRAIADPAISNSLYLCRTTAVELTSAVTRRQRGGAITAADAALVLAAFRQDFALQYRIVELTPALLDSAVVIAESYGLRAYDAVQLAVASECTASETLQE